MGRSIHGIVKDINTLKGLNSLLNNGGLTDYGLSYVGGFNVLVTLGNPRIVNEVMANKSDCLASVFSQFKVWKGEDIPLDRIVTLRITGVPVHLRDNVLFDQIGGLFGRVVQESAFSWLGSNNDENTVLVLAPPGKRIEESVVLRWEGRSYIIWVSEDFTVWKPEIEGESSMDNEGYDSDECSSDGSYENEEQSNGPMSEDEEEGEFRHHECTNPASEGPVDFPADGSPTPERLLSPECGRFRNEKSAEGSETFRISGNNDYGGNGEEFSHGKHNDDVGTEKMAAEKVGGDSQFLEERGTDHVTHNPVSEPTPQHGLGKRPRAFRSPPSSGSMQGPPTRNCLQGNRSDEESFDLNRPGFTESSVDGVPYVPGVRSRSEPNPVEGESYLQPDVLLRSEGVSAPDPGSHLPDVGEEV
ncbi:hypothetical protein HanPI659440_Chr01g0008521 [Helianthus annuus]|nr:hypothetical protein HanPI659440_Chr01g0008521 [Helianthus annuus]